jgi:hypothetical protein
MRVVGMLPLSIITENTSLLVSFIRTYEIDQQCKTSNQSVALDGTWPLLKSSSIYREIITIALLLVAQLNQ